jgi:hypothetical protein
VNALDVATPLGDRTVRVTTALGGSNALTRRVVGLALAPATWAIGGRGQVTVSGITLAAGNTFVTVGGAAPPTAQSSARSLELGPITGAPGPAAVALTSGGLAFAPVEVPLAALVVSEVDSDTPSSDVLEFVEVAAGMPAVSLDGYCLVLYNGFDDKVYDAIDLGPGGDTDGAGLLVVGNARVSPAIAIANGSLQNGPDAVALYQGAATSFPAGASISTSGLIDAVVYGTGDATDDGLVAGLLGAGPGALQLDEDAAGLGVSQAVARCSDARLDGRAFATLDSSPGAPNPCP